MVAVGAPVPERLEDWPYAEMVKIHYENARAKITRGNNFRIEFFSSTNVIGQNYFANQDKNYRRAIRGESNQMIL